MDATLEPQRRGAADGADRPMTDRPNDVGASYRWCQARCSVRKPFYCVSVAAAFGLLGRASPLPKRAL